MIFYFIESEVLVVNVWFIEGVGLELMILFWLLSLFYSINIFNVLRFVFELFVDNYLLNRSLSNRCSICICLLYL